ncbi:MAG: exodeoxyribonuclease V subunit gamma [Cyanobacteria bacterium REEB67]|nr:exodeoxyribonuclease V subunit gamma [Cyanobacteria bacterium REEB67]
MSANSVELITGPYRAGKSIELLGELVDYLAAAPLRSRPAILTVPSQRYKQLVGERLDKLMRLRGKSLPGLFGLKILPFYELCHFVLRQSGQSFRTLPDPLRPAILEKAIDEVKASGRLVNLADIAHFAGTHAGILELIDELERAGFSPSDVISTLAKQSQTNSRYMELARIYEAYWRELERLNIYDERKLAYKTREILNNLDAGVLPLGFFAVDGFDRFNRLQLHVLSGLARQADRSVIAFDYLAPPAEFAGGAAPRTTVDGGDNVLAYRQTFEDYRWKEKSIRELHEVFGAALKRTEIGAIGSVNHPPALIKNWRSLDRMMEMDELVRQLKVALDAGLSSRDAVIVVRSVQPYLSAIRAAFEKAEVEYFLDEPVELVSVPLIKYLLRLLRLAAKKFARAEVVRSLSSPFYNQEFLGLTARDIELLDEESLRLMVVNTRADWQPLKAGPTLARFFDAVTPPAGNLSLSEFVVFVEDVVEQLLVLPNDDEYADPRVTWEEHQALFEFRRVLSNLLLEENLLGTAYAEKGHIYEALLDRFEKALEKANFRRPRGGDQGVTVCSADLVPNRKFKAIFVAGLVEGEFPRRSEKPGFLSRDEVRKWMSYGIDIENPRNHDSFEISLYKSLLERATDTLYVSCPLYEVSGEELTPSFFLSQGDNKILEAIPFVAPFENSLAAPVSALDLASGLLWHGASEPEHFEAPALNDLYGSMKESLGVVKARTVSDAVRNFALWNGNISLPVELGAVKINTPEIWSVSRLNDFGKCPFRFWVSHILGVKKIEEPEVGLDARLLGELYHKTLELFYKDLSLHGLTILSGDEPVGRIFEESIAKAIFWLETEKPFKKGEFWDYEQNEIRFRLRRFFSKELERAEKSGNEFVPHLFEQAFGFDDEEADSAPALVIKAGGRTIKIRGRIDRLDRSEAGVYRVIDYKSGSGSIKVDEALAGRNMQLPIYGMALSQAVQPGARVKSGSYLSIQSGEQTGSVSFDDPEIDLVGSVEANIGRFVQNIFEGKFAVEPTSKQSCDYCDHSQICRITELSKTGAFDGSEESGSDFEGVN